MPRLQSTPLSDPFAGIDPSVNPFVDKMREGLEQGLLPLVYGPQLGALRGHWLEQKGSKKTDKLLLEIGCHKGVTLLDIAKDHPDWHCMGCDITFKRVVTTAERAHRQQLENVTVIYANAKGLDEVFAPGELDSVLIFFPDPWTKKERQVHNRLIDKEFIASLYRVLKPGGFLWLKTDAKSYFESAAEGLAAVGFLSAETQVPEGFRDYGSSYESKFKRLDTATFSGVWLKAGNKH